MSGEEVGPLAVRRAGVLLHVTSLPGGRLGPEAYAFVDRLAAAGATVWQGLPLGPPAGGGAGGRAPRGAPRAGGASPPRARRAGAAPPGLPAPAEPPPAPGDPAYAAWCEREAGWLEPYVEYRTLRALHGDVAWTEWEPGLRDRDPARVAVALRTASDLAERLRAEQWSFAEQWRRLRE